MADSETPRTDAWSKIIGPVNEQEGEISRLQRELAASRRDIQAYRGALGYSVPGDHDGRLSNGETPKCGLCEASQRRVEGLEKALNAQPSIVPLALRIQELEKALRVAREYVASVHGTIASAMGHQNTIVKPTLDMIDAALSPKADK